MSGSGSRPRDYIAEIMNDSPILPVRRCPICGKLPVQKYRPFCSARCAQIDLGRWLKDGYRIESDESPEDSDPER